MSEKRIIVFTDGASKRNPGPGGWGVIIIRPDGHVTELGGGAAHTTNNRMELTGAIQALTHIEGTSGPVSIYTDSSYVIQGITGWVHGWKRRGWKTATGSDVLNRELWEELSTLVAARGLRAIAWHHVRGHAGIAGNERVDEIADSFALGTPVPLYDGPLSGYAVPVLDLHGEPDVPQPSPRNGSQAPASDPGSTRSANGSRRRAKGAAYSYLSVVDGKPMRHTTWAECEQRVKGRAGARYKKAMSPEEQDEILRAWSFSPDDLR
jgi:ribonuclease HI